MILLQLVKRLMGSFVECSRKHIRLIKLQKKYPNCRFYKGVLVNNTTFKGFNVLFNDVVVSSCSFGVHSYVQKKSTVFNAEIGRFCSIASNVSIAPGMHKSDGVSTHPAFFLKNTPLMKVFSKEDMFATSAKVIIGHDVWIGERAIIMDGVTIGIGAIIAAGAVVTKNVESYSIVGGIPAKHIKYRFDEQTRNFLQESQWWDYPNEWFEENAEIMLDVENFIAKIRCS